MPEQLQEISSATALQFIGEYPGRWGRMDTISRLAVVEVGKVLWEAGLISGERYRVPEDLVVGIVVGSRRGSLRTDLDFIASMQEEIILASPALFGYTLPNISLAEAACHFGLRGPVYSLLQNAFPAQLAEAEARFWLETEGGPSGMIWGMLDCYPGSATPQSEEIITVDLHYMGKECRS